MITTIVLFLLSKEGSKPNVISVWCVLLASCLDIKILLL